MKHLIELFFLLTIDGINIEQIKSIKHKREIKSLISQLQKELLCIKYLHTFFNKMGIIVITFLFDNIINIFSLSFNIAT